MSKCKKKTFIYFDFPVQDKAVLYYVIIYVCLNNILYNSKWLIWYSLAVPYSINDSILIYNLVYVPSRSSQISPQLNWHINGTFKLFFHLTKLTEFSNLTPSIYTVKTLEINMYMWLDTICPILLGKTSMDVKRTPYFGPLWKISGRPYSSQK